MEATSGSGSSRSLSDAAANSRRRRRGATARAGALLSPKSGSSSEKPELGQEAASEAEALVEAFRGAQVFYTLVAWSAVPELNGSEAKITKRPLARE
jgi:hypothetical protein